MKFFANLVDQLDFALEHIVLEDVNYKRLSLMLVDNAMELTLHQFATDQRARARPFDPEPRIEPGVLAAALGQNFDAKLRLAEFCGLVDEDTAASIATLHSYRNQLYHQGMRHEEVLPALALFYFRVTCDVLIAYKPLGFSWSNRDRVPHRAVKYVGREPMRNAAKTFLAAWTRLREVSESIPLDLAADLHAHMEATIIHTDEMIEYLVGYDPKNRTRNWVVRDSQAWSVAFTEEAKGFAREQAAPVDTVGGYVEWLAANFPFPVRADPIKSWKRRLASLKRETDEHKALRKYQEFMVQTQPFREAIDKATAAMDQDVENQIERMRGG